MAKLNVEAVVPNPAIINPTRLRNISLNFGEYMSLSLTNLYCLFLLVYYSSGHFLLDSSCIHRLVLMIVEFEINVIRLGID